MFFMPQKELLEAYSNRTVRPSFVSGSYLLYSLRKEFQIWCVDDGVWLTIFVSLTLNLTSDLVFRIIVFLETALSLVHISYIL